MIPTSTGAAKAIGLVMPSLHGRLDGTSVRVPTADVSLVDLVVTTGRKTSRDEINRMMIDAANSNRFKGILSVTDEELVSVDFIHDPHSSIFDLTQTTMMGDRFARVLSWYDNEWGFSNRMVEAAALVGKLGD
jgi:glyceraldehyde 3-phosphate dehydrogenase